MKQRAKNPAKVRAGKARQRQLRDQLGADGYRDYQKARYAETLTAHPDFHTQGRMPRMRRRSRPGVRNATLHSARPPIKRVAASMGWHSCSGWCAWPTRSGACTASISRRLVRRRSGRC